MNSTTHNITSIDFIVKSLYESKFNQWLVSNNLNSIITKQDWSVQSDDLNIQLYLINEEDKSPFIKCKFNIGMMHVKSETELKKTIIDMNLYAEKPELLGFILTEPVYAEDEMYLHFSYRFNLLKELDVVEYFNLIYKQLKDIVDDVEFRLGVVLTDFILEDEYKDQDEDQDEDDSFFNSNKPHNNDDDGGNIKSFVSPYNGGD
jgi:hypothetical protein